jgi:cytochrome c oxidase assembly protein subunit 15
MAQKNKSIIIWLMFCCSMVFLMAVVGAITRLTESGLSIAEWKPITGAMPPLTEAEWQRVFNLYQSTPEFIQKHHWMALGDFKKIFFWEWFHRLLGRLIGVIYAAPLLWFWFKKKIPKGYGRRLLFILALGGAQGLMGWVMVASGLVDRPSVSHYRLAAHLSLALVIYAAMAWTVMDLKIPPPLFCLPPARREGGRTKEGGLFRHTLASFLLLSLTIIWGAFTAGLDAGMVYNTFPLMNGSIAPPEAFNVFENHGWVQFTHRWLAIITGLMILAIAVRTKDKALGAMVLVQIGLGVATLLSHVFIPLAAAHQAGAIILMTLLLVALHRLKQTVYPAQTGD